MDASSKDNTTKPWGIWICQISPVLFIMQGHSRLILLCLKYIFLSIISTKKALEEVSQGRELIRVQGASGSSYSYMVNFR